MIEPTLLWQQTWQKLGVITDKTDLLQQILSQYNHPDRKYHTQQHLTECLEHFNKIQHLTTHPEEIALALFFHDAIYQIGKHVNEQKSAAWAKNSLTQEMIVPEIVLRIEKLILATVHQAIPQHSDEQFMVDIDLAILGANRQRFSEYEQQVRQEYHFVPDWLFRHERKKILRQFLKRPQIYATDYFYNLLEKQARSNLEHTLNIL